MTYMERIIELYPQLKGREEEFAYEFCPNKRFSMTKQQSDELDVACYVGENDCVSCWDLPYNGEQLAYGSADDILAFIEGKEI